MRTEISNISKNYFVLSGLEGGNLIQLFQLYYKGTQNNNEATLLLNAIHNLTKNAGAKSEKKILNDIIDKCDKAISLFTDILPNIPRGEVSNAQKIVDDKPMIDVNKSYNLCMGYLEQLIDLKENLLDLIELKDWPTDFDNDPRIIKQEIDPGILFTVPVGLKCINAEGTKTIELLKDGLVILFNDGANYYFLGSSSDDEKKFIPMDEVTQKLNIESLKWCSIDEYPLLPETGKLEVNHVQQGAMGDCFLISSLIGTVNKDPYLISRHIYEDGENVYVKFFDVKGGNQPYFVKTDKKIVRLKYSTLNKSKRLASNTPYLWPAIVEKAYAIFASKHLLPHDQSAPISNKSALKMLQGGYDDMALSPIIGENYNQYEFTGSEKNFNLIKFLNEYGLWNADQIEIALKIIEQRKILKRLERKRKNESGFSLVDSLVFWKRFVPAEKKTGINTLDSAFPLIKNWCKFLTEMKIKYFFEDRLGGGYIYQETLRHEDFLKLLNGEAFYKNGRKNDGVISCDLEPFEVNWINKILIEDKVFPKKRGQFVYSQYQLDIFSTLKEIENKNQIILLNTFLNKRTDRNYYFTIMPHTYVFLRTEEIDNEKYIIALNSYSNPKDNRETIYIPRLSREYNQNGTEINNPPTPRILKMDLSDFTKRFDIYTTLNS